MKWNDFIYNLYNLIEDLGQCGIKVSYLKKKFFENKETKKVIYEDFELSFLSKGR